MIDDLSGYHLIGIYRAGRPFPKLSEQKAALAMAGVDLKWYGRDANAVDVLEKIQKDFRPISKDVDPCAIITPFLGALGKHRSKILKAAGLVDGVLYDLGHDRLFTLKEAADRDLIEDECKSAQSAPGRAAVKNPGPKSRFTSQDRRDQRDAWESLDGTNIQVAARWDVSDQWMWSKYGSRKTAQRKAIEK